MINTLHISQILTKVKTAKTLSPRCDECDDRENVVGHHCIRGTLKKYSKYNYHDEGRKGDERYKKWSGEPGFSFTNKHKRLNSKTKDRFL